MLTSLKHLHSVNYSTTMGKMEKSIYPLHQGYDEDSEYCYHLKRPLYDMPSAAPLEETFLLIKSPVKSPLLPLLLLHKLDHNGDHDTFTFTLKP